MPEISPQVAAELAQRIYQVQNPRLVEDFLEMTYFMSTNKKVSSPHVHLKAEVGGRVILNHRDGFGICAQGRDANDLFNLSRHYFA